MHIKITRATRSTRDKQAPGNADAKTMVMVMVMAMDIVLVVAIEKDNGK